MENDKEEFPSAPPTYEEATNTSTYNVGTKKTCLDYIVNTLLITVGFFFITLGVLFGINKSEYIVIIIFFVFGLGFLSIVFYKCYKERNEVKGCLLTSGGYCINFICLFLTSILAFITCPCYIYSKLDKKVKKNFINFSVFTVLLILSITFTVLYHERDNYLEENRIDSACKYAGGKILKRESEDNNKEEFLFQGTLKLDVYALVENSTRVMNFYRVHNLRDFEYSDEYPEDDWSHNYNDHKESSESFDNLFNKPSDDYTECKVDPYNLKNYNICVLNFSGRIEYCFTGESAYSFYVTMAVLWSLWSLFVVYLVVSCC